MLLLYDQIQSTRENIIIYYIITLGNIIISFFGGVLYLRVNCIYIFFIFLIFFPL